MDFQKDITIQIPNQEELLGRETDYLELAKALNAGITATLTDLAAGLENRFQAIEQQVQGQAQKQYDEYMGGL